MQHGPAMCMKKKAALTKCPAKYMAFTRKFRNCPVIDKIRADFLAEHAQIAR
jgi:hypothetical protein